MEITMGSIQIICFSKTADISPLFYERGLIVLIMKKKMMSRTEGYYKGTSSYVHIQVQTRTLA